MCRDWRPCCSKQRRVQLQQPNRDGLIDAPPVLIELQRQCRAAAVDLQHQRISRLAVHAETALFQLPPCCSRTTFQLGFWKLMTLSKSESPRGTSLQACTSDERRILVIAHGNAQVAKFLQPVLHRHLVTDAGTHPQGRVDLSPRHPRGVRWFRIAQARISPNTTSSPPP